MFNKLVECKNKIRESIESRGIEVTGGMSTYADLIYQIRGNIYTLDFSSLNYDSRMKNDAYRCVNRIMHRYVNNYHNVITFPTKEYCESKEEPFEINKAVVAVPVFTPYTNDIGWYHTGMFAGQHIITHIPKINTANVSNMRNAFYECWSINHVELLDCSSYTNAVEMFGGRSLSYGAGAMANELVLDGLYNLGMQEELSCSRILDTPAYISRQSLLNVFNNLYDRASAGYSVVTFTIRQSHHDLLSADDVAIATNKGWNIEVI
jgi:hypothetical protein